MSRRIDERKECNNALEEMEDEYVIDASYFQDLREQCIKECETAEAYARKYERDGDNDLAQRSRGMSDAYGAIAVEIADKLSYLGIPWSSK